MTNIQTTHKIEISPFDNEVSILYKWAKIIGEPIRLIVVKKRADSEDQINKQPNVGILSLEEQWAHMEFESLFDSIRRELAAGKSLVDLSNDYIDKDANDLSVIYYYLTAEFKPIDQIITDINAFNTSLGLTPIITNDQLIGIVGNWKASRDDDFSRDMFRLDNLQDIQQRLLSYPPLFYSPIKISGISISASPKFENRIPEPEDGPDIFNLSKPSYHTPFVQYNKGAVQSQAGEVLKKGRRMVEVKEHIIEKGYYKLYLGETSLESGPLIDYSPIIKPSSINSLPDTIYTTIWTGEGDPLKASKTDYVDISYNLRDNNLIAKKCPVGDGKSEKNIIDRITSSLPITIDKYKELRVNGKFYIYNIVIDEVSLLHVILNEEIPNNYLYVDETQKPYAEKKELNIHYKSVLENLDEELPTGLGYIRNPSSVTVSLKQLYANEDMSIEVTSKNGPQVYILPSGTPYIEVVIPKAVSRNVAQQFAEIFSRIMSYYVTSREGLPSPKNNINSIYMRYIPQLAVLSQKYQLLAPTKKQLAEKKIKTKKKQLQELAPDLIVDGYARVCQCPYQPIIINPEEIPAWTAQTFTIKGQTYYRQVMEFPSADKKQIWYFGCTNVESPFPGVKKNKKMANLDKYPVVPCCYKKDQIDPNSNSTYNEYFRGKIKEKKIGKNEHFIGSDKPLKLDRTGYVRRSISDLLSKYKEANGQVHGPVNIVRLGVVHSPSSLIHCVLTAGNVTNYLQLDPEGKEIRVQQYRSVLANHIKAELLKQEMYDYTNQEILSKLSDNSVFLDPALFYRAIEEVFNINIFVFVPPNTEEQEMNEFGNMEIPRHKLFHVRSFDMNRKTVLIYKLSGAAAAGLEQPQCELMIDISPQSEQSNKSPGEIITKMFDSSMTRLLMNTYNSLNQVMTWSISNQVITARRNVSFEVQTFLSAITPSLVPKSQILDNYGKLRGLVFSNNILMIFPPAQPMNLTTIPISSRPTITTTIDQVLQLFVNVDVSSVTRTGNLITGLWFPILDIVNGIYVPVIPEYKAELDYLPIGPNDPIFPKENTTSKISRIKNLKKKINFLLQLILWNFLLSKLTPTDYAKKYLYLPEVDMIGDSDNIYNLSGLSRKLPRLENADQSISYLKRTIPNIIVNDKILTYTRKFYNGVVYFLKDYLDSHKGLIISLPREINGFFTEETDFIQQNHVAVFLSEEEMKRWLGLVANKSYNETVIYDKLKLDYGLLTTPYIYKDESRRIYIVQNLVPEKPVLSESKEGTIITPEERERIKLISLRRALALANNWYLNRVNTGYRTAPFEPKEEKGHDVYYDYVILGISNGGTLATIADYTNGRIPYLQILRYGGEESNQFAALLPIL